MNMASYWIKLYTEVLEDPKVATLSDRLWRRFFELCLVAGKAGQDGKLPDLEELAWMLRLNPADLQADIEALTGKGLVQASDEGNTVTNFAKRQAAVPAHERYAEFRKRNPQYVPPSLQQNANETQTERLESREESDTDTESTTAAAGAREKSENGKVFQVFEQEIGALTPFIAESLGEMAGAYSEPWLVGAMQEAARSGVRNLKYVRSILERWKREGFNSPRVKSAEGVPRGNGKKPVGGASEDVLRLIESGV